MEKGELRRSVVDAMKRLGKFTNSDLSRETKVPTKILGNYLRYAQHQSLLTRDGYEYTVVGDITTLVVNRSKSGFRGGLRQLSLPVLPELDLKGYEERMQSIPEYVAFLEDALIRERSDHKDLRDWVQRTMTRVPEPKRYRVPMEG